MHRPQAHHQPTDLTAFNQQLLLSGPSKMNQPAGLSMLQQQLLSLTPEMQLALLTQVQARQSVPPFVPTSGPLAPAIQPNLEIAVSVDNLAWRMEGLKKELLTLKWPRNDSKDDSNDGDIEPDDKNQPCPHPTRQHATRKKQKKEPKYILNVPKGELLIASEIGEEQDQDIDEDNAAEPPKMAFNLQGNTSSEANSAVFMQAANIIWKEQQSKFRSYKRKYIEKTNEEKAEKCRQFNTTNKCLRRQEHLAEDQEKAVEEYKARNEKDPTDLL
ncbi:hypothetical protein EDB19DRAFT_1919721 [Suillus lakei]|nr:hypothetical protein EDB19DRAFT_1919721 [Suillus lakei]